MDQKRKIVVAGHICLDITPKFQNDPAAKLTDLLQPGSLLEMGSADVHIGGSVANTGLALKTLGADVTLMGKIGTDAFGILVKEQVSQYVSVKHMLETKEDPTSYSVVIAPKGTDRMFLHCPGANANFSGRDLDYDVIRQAQLFHFGYPPLMKRMFENNGEELVRMLRKIKELKVATSLDMASVDENTESGKADWALILQKVLPFVDFFVPSIEELAYMIDKPRFMRWKERAGNGDVTDVIGIEEIQKLAETLLEWGAKIVLIKCGAPGLYLATEDRKELQDLDEDMGLNFAGWENIRYFERSFLPDRVLSATGAGDTTIAAFLYAVLSGYCWQDCVRYAAATGACCVEAYDAISGLMTFDKLKQRMDTGWKKQDVSGKKDTMK